MTSKDISTRSIDPYAYSINVCRVQVEGEWFFRATVAELPDVATFEETYEAAYSLAIEAIESLHETCVENDRAFPEARSIAESQGYSGRLTLRMPRWLHSQLGVQANAEGISLNQYLISILSAAGSINALVQDASEKICRSGEVFQNVALSRAVGVAYLPIIPSIWGMPRGAMDAESVKNVVGNITYLKAEASSTLAFPRYEQYLIEGNC